MVQQLYRMISDSKLFHSDSTGKWLTMSESKFLAPGILCHSSISASEENEDVPKILKHLSVPLVRLPLKYRSHLHLTAHTMNEDDFLCLFFEHLGGLSAIQHSRDQLILSMLEVYAAEYDDGTERSYTIDGYLRHLACIPCAPDGCVLRKCSELIDPGSKFAELYDEEEHRFPLKYLVTRRLASTALFDLGMLSEKLSYTDVVERAETVTRLFHKDKPKALRRIKLILKTIQFNMKDVSQNPPNVTLDTISFLPVLQKPHEYPLTWAGESDHLLCGKDLVLCSDSRKFSDNTNAVIAGSQVAILNEHDEGGCGSLSAAVQRVLKVRSSPSCDDVVLHLSQLIQMFNPKTATPDLRNWVNRMCRQAYRFLDERTTEEEKKSIQKLTKLPCIWNEEKFLHVQHIARQWKLNGPYLHPVPSAISLRKHLCEVLAVKEEFSNEDVENAIKEMKVDFGDQPVDEKCQQLLKELVSYLLKIKPNEFTHFQILLPDEKYALVSSSDLAYNDAPWAPRDESHRFVNDIIPRSLAIQLHVEPVRTKWLDKYVNPNAKFGGSEFGQKEELTRRIQNILRDYPFDITVLKELLQNADDARASKMCVILDKRSHGSQGVLSEEWQKLQGPALLVWNDSTFSEKDFSGIQELGLGSKRSESDTIGQYGIGFNSVYHLTDCPSFVSDGDTLCVMDPHCRYVPGATPLSPGRRFDNLKSGFWDQFKDMKSAYLRSNLENLPEEFLGGSLFRFPLRSTFDLMMSSEIVADLPKRTTISSSKMQDHLDEWAPKMMKAMFFLNSVRELRFYVIERNNVVDIQHHYCINVSQSAQEKCDYLQGKVLAFKGSEPCVVMYPLTLVDKLDSENELKQKWIINQGIGDVEKQHQTWSSVNNVKPRHGIAAPTDARSSNLEGQVFCFLPLPISSSLPVHINGHFMLNSTRRQLWRATNPDEEDGLSIWNKNLISAIASSYANFLANSPRCYVSQHHYSKWKTLLDDIRGYYSNFPLARPNTLDREWLALAKDCFRKVCKANSSILAVVVKEDTTGHDVRLIVTWHPIISEVDSLQVYFWSRGVGEAKTIEPVLEAIGMKITSAPYRLRHFLNDAIDSEDKQCPEISPSSVYVYYVRFSSQVTSGQLPCDITATSFKSIENFKIFTSYVLGSPSSDAGGLKFPSPPFGYPLLLTADGKLRTFDEKREVLLSEFVKLFPNSSATFVHPALLDIKYSETYFATENSDYSVVHNILFENLSQSLCDAERCQNARTLLPVEKLQQLWSCFTSDSVFSSNLAAILQRWALILTTDDRLFSSACQLRPILPPSNDDLNSIEVFQVLERIEMPVVDTSVIVNPSVIGCPDLSKHTDVLASLFHLSKESTLSAVLCRQDIEILVTYLSSINYRQNSVCCQQVRGIPIFEDVNGNFTSISTVQAYVWPRHCMCEVAYSKWIYGYSTVFLKPQGSWCKLSSPTELSIMEIVQEDMYVNFIFPHFFLMSESERYEHLRYIRDNLFYINKINSENTRGQYDVRQRASSFISALRNLECIGSDGQPLHTVSDFCDHEKEIFTTFEKHFQFLPSYFTNDPQEQSRWMEFFRSLGLKTNIDHDEFLQFCKETANGHVPAVQTASRVLVKSLFSAEEGWYSHPGFLYQVSRIAFLCTEKVSSLRWIVPPVVASHRIQPTGGEHIDMTESFNAAVEGCQTLIWTVKPVVKLPVVSSLLSLQNTVILQGLSVCTEPNVSDVIQNLCNICEQSRFGKFSLFDKYPSSLEPPAIGDALPNVLLEHFMFLQKNLESLTSDDITTLQKLACIPIHASPELHKYWQIVLVKPQSVLICDVNDYHPFLNQLGSDFRFVTQLLERLGVGRELELKHMQRVLELAYQCTEGQKMDINTRQCIVKAVKFVHKHLSGEGREQDKLSPLYLPNKGGVLTLSTKLLYADKSIYEGGESLDLRTIEYTELGLFPYFEYRVYPKELCRLLAPSIRPRPLSELCRVEVSSESQRCDASSIARKLVTTFQLSVLPNAVVNTLTHYAGSNEKENVKRLLPVMENALKNIKVITCSNIKLKILLKETGGVLGNKKVWFFLDSQESGSTLYLDPALSKFHEERMFSTLVDHLVSVIEQHCTCNSTLFYKALKLFLKAESNTDLIQELTSRCIPIGEIASNGDVTLSLGMDIPPEWHYRLDQDVDNVFHANEFVAYEPDEGHYMLVKIIHAVISGDTQDPLSNYRQKYLVAMSEEDVEGREVSKLSLYKFIKGLRREEQPEPSSERSLVPFEGVTDVRSGDNYDLKSVKRKLCRELREIWMLDENERKYALRRLYLKWHPDKNLDNEAFAEIVFKFLQAQIEKLERGDPLDDPDDEQPTATYHSSGTGQWSRNFHSWDSTAGQHRRSYQSDYRRSRGSRGSSGSRGYSGFGFGFHFTAGDANYRVPRQPEEGKRWMRQATVDYEVLTILHRQMSDGGHDNIAGHVCFRAHQVAEIALKAGMFAVCGLDAQGLNDCSLTRHAFALQTERPTETHNLAQHAVSLENYYLDARYPSQHTPPVIPADAHTPTEAEQAKEHAEHIFVTIRSLIDNI